jgi:lycopene beta-cyclase
MSYMAFHLVFIFPPLLVLLWAVRRSPEVLGPRAWWILPAVALIALVYTTPLDNYLVYRGIWWYGEDRVIATIGYVPVEEYMFFVLQPLLTGAWTFWLLMRQAAGGDSAGDASRRTGEHAAEERATPSAAVTRAYGVGFYLILTAAGVLALTFERGLYMGLILAWAAPVLAAQWVFAGPAIVRSPRLYALAVWVPTLYLWVADRLAIGMEIWSISEQYTTGLHLFGLPVEEALFFLVTNVLVVQGVVLFLRPDLVKVPGREAEAVPAA